MPPQNLQSQNLQGRSFEGQDLTGANFTGARAGLSPAWLAALSVLALLAAGLAGLIMGWGSTFATVVYDLKEMKYEILFGFILILLLFFIILLLQGLGAFLGVFATTVAAIIAVIAYVVPGDKEYLGAIIVLSIYGSTIGVGVFIGGLAYTISFFLKKKVLSVLSGLFALACAFAGLWEGVRGPFTEEEKTNHLVASGVITLIQFAISFYLGRKTTQGDGKYKLIRTLAVNLCCLGGTSFRGADLTGADFSQATLNHADFRQATLTRTCWSLAAGLDQARLEGTYLANPVVQPLVTSLDGQHKNFDSQDLRGLNLKNANLADSSFIAANLSDATLQGADLSRAQLVQTLLYGTDLAKTCLTGACIQDWAISTTTKFDGIKCDFIYLRLPTEADPDPWRKPDNTQEIFQEGDFTEFIAPIIKTLDIYRQQTLDLYHYQGFDPAAAVIALKKLDEAHPEAGIAVVALKGEGSSKISLQTVVSRHINRSELSASYYDNYNQIKALPEAEIQSNLLAVMEKDEQIRDLAKLLASAWQQPKFYVETLPVKRLTVILFISADPSDQARLRIGEEFREIKEKLKLAQLRDQFKLELPELSARTEDISQALLDASPEIVHFSGHGESSGLVFEDKIGETHIVEAEALAALFEQFQDQVKCVVLNACYSETQAQAIARYIKHVIGMHQAIGDQAAIAFSVGFYQALGAGRTIEQAYKMGCVQIGLQGIPEHLTPVLIKKEQP